MRMKLIMLKSRHGIISSIMLLVMTCAASAFAQTKTLPNAVLPDPEFDRILALDIAELSVTTVSRIPEMINRAAAAVYVISRHDLKRAGVTSIPEALRMVPGVQVAQAGSHGWAVSIRGFNGQFANKLQVLMDGRSIYSPIFSGVYWDMEDTLLEDIERIEVIRGPGATLWGSNAVNGIINIVTKKATDTQGRYLSTSIGNHEYLTTEGRYGGKLDNGTFYRVYAKQLHRGKTTTLNNQDAFDDWSRLRSGFRLDKTQEDDNYTIQGDIYGGEQGLLTSTPSLTPPFSTTTPSEDEAYGGNVLARLDRTISDTSNLRLQFYINNYSRSEIVAKQQQVTSIDTDFQHVLKPTSRHELVWGGGYRYIFDTLKGSPTATFREGNDRYDIANIFIQDQYAIIPDKLLFTLGSKLEHNDFTGTEIQPTTKISWRMAESQTVWAAISHAVRVPSRAENDPELLALVTPGAAGGAPNAFYIIGNDNVKSEKLTAYELGYKLYPSPRLSINISGFFNDYDQLSTFNQGTSFNTNSATILPFSYTNNGQGHVYGVETAVKWNVSTRWQLNATYSYLLMDLHAGGGSFDTLTGIERVNPNHQLSFRSILDLPRDLEWDNMIYYVDDILGSDNTAIAENIRFDTRLGWQPIVGLELSVIGRNLFNARHPEFSGSPTIEIGPSVIGIVAWKF